jgi:hypothetical protein
MANKTNQAFMAEVHQKQWVELALVISLADFRPYSKSNYLAVQAGSVACNIICLYHMTYIVTDEQRAYVHGNIDATVEDSFDIRTYKRVSDGCLILKQGQQVSARYMRGNSYSWLETREI